MLVLHKSYLTCCSLAFLPHAISGWDKKQSERWVIASIFLLHDLCRTQFPINNVRIALLSPPRAQETLTYAACCQPFWDFFLTFIYTAEVCWTRLLFSRHNLLHICIDSHVHTGELPAVHPVMPCLYLATVQLHWSSWGLLLVQGRLRGAGRRACFSFAFSAQSFPSPHSNWRPSAHKPASKAFGVTASQYLIFALIFTVLLVDLLLYCHWFQYIDIFRFIMHWSD